MMTFTTVDRVLLVVLVLLVAALFARDLRPKIRHILAGPTDRLRTDRIGRRLAVTAREVLLQSRVIGGRPVAGAMHAAVFLGFLCFALETADHFLEPFGVPFLASLLGPALGGFKLFLAGVAVLVSLAIAGLAFRRFAMPGISPDPRSWSSGVVALMILLLMLTYIYGITPEPRFEKANWWLHAALIMAFPPLILRSKHFHILMAPVNIFFRNHRLGDLLSLDLDLEALEESEEEVALGLESMANVPWKMRMDFLTCVECKRCTEQCPANNCDQELDPRGFVLAGREALGSDGEVIGQVISETALGQCTTCGACENICPVGIEHLQVLMGAKRAQALATGKGMVAADFLQAVERTGNPFAEPASVRAKLLQELGIPLYRKGETEYLLWLGCVWTYNADARSSLAALIELLDRAGISYGVLEAESCSGHHSRRQGEELQFQTLAAENIAAMKDKSVARVLTGCPHCFHTFRREYPTLDAEFSVDAVHHSELLARLVQEGRLTPAAADGHGRRYTFHDPCYLGRFEGVYEAPRQILAGAGLDFVELTRRRERSFCCGGGGGGFTRTHEEEKRVDQERKREIADSGADVLITGCPECKMMLDAAVKETYDLAELLAQTTRGVADGPKQPPG